MDENAITISPIYQGWRMGVSDSHHLIELI